MAKVDNLNEAIKHLHINQNKRNHLRSLLCYFIKTPETKIASRSQNEEKLVLLDTSTSMQHKRNADPRISTLRNECYYNHWAIITCL